MLCSAREFTSVEPSGSTDWLSLPGTTRSIFLKMHRHMRLHTPHERTCYLKNVVKLMFHAPTALEAGVRVSAVGVMDIPSCGG